MQAPTQIERTGRADYLGAAYLLFVVKEPVPTHEEWTKTHQK